MEELTLLQYLLWSVAFAALVLLFKGVSGSRKCTALPPGPRSLPFLGNLLDLGKCPHSSLARLARIHGPVMSLKLGSIYTVVISSPDSAKEVLQTKDSSFSGRCIPDALKALGHYELSVVWMTPNKEWRYLRALMKTNLFNTQSLGSTQLLRQQKVRELVAYIREEEGKSITIIRAAFCTTLNLISSTFFSFNMADIKSESSQEIKDLMRGLIDEVGKHNVSDFFPFLASMDLQGRKRGFKAHMKKLYDFFNQTIENRLGEAVSEEGGRRHPDILDELLRLNREDGTKLSRRMIITLLADIFSAGSDTSSSTLEWAMAELLRRPELMRKARAEIATTIGFKREVEESDISRLPFLQSVVKETFRLHPPVPFLVPHKAIRSTKVNSYTVPVGSQVFVNVWAIGRNEQIWKDADLFNPERFTGQGSETDFHGQCFELLPFGSGRRACPGLPLGVRMVELMLASLIQSFEWSLPGGMAPKDLDMTEKFGLTLTMEYSLKAIATPAFQI